MICGLRTHARPGQTAGLPVRSMLFDFEEANIFSGLLKNLSIFRQAFDDIALTHFCR